MNDNKKGCFDFCNKCPISTGCCTGNQIDLPVIVREEAEDISENIGLSFSDFLQKPYENVTQIKRVDNRCYFYKNDRCTIYNYRPFDCRLFPYDIRRDEHGKYNLILYTNFCSLKIDSTKYINNIKALIESSFSYLEPYLEEFTSLRWAKLLQNHDYKIVCTDLFNFDLKTGCSNL